MSAARRVGVGIIGTGNISSAYLKAMKGFDVLDIRGLADLKADLAEDAGQLLRIPQPVQGADVIVGVGHGWSAARGGAPRRGPPVGRGGRRR